MFAMFGLIKFAANEASTKSAERIRATRKKKAKKTAGKSARPNARKKTLKRESVAQNRKTAKKRPLSKGILVRLAEDGVISNAMRRIMYLNMGL